MRDEYTDEPLLFMSCDAHAERVYDGETWGTVYKMFNGMRVWSVDKASRRLIALGGEFSVGDCHTVAEAFADLIRRGILPADGDYGDGVVAKLVFIADGMPCFDDTILPLFPSATPVLDLLNLRMMSVIGNDERFWDDPQMRAQVDRAFNPGDAS